MTLHHLYDLPAVMVPDAASWYPHIGAWLATGAEAHKAVHALMDSAPRRVAVDSETPGLGALSFTIKCFTAAWETDAGTVAVLLDPSRREIDASLVREILRRASELVLQHAPFDVPPLYQNGLLELEHIAKIYDTAVYGRMAFPEKEFSKSLENLAPKLAGFPEAEMTMGALYKTNGWTLAEGYREMDVDRPVYRIGAMADTVATLRLLPAIQAACWERLTSGHPFTEMGLDSAGAQAVMEREQAVNRIMMRRSARGLEVDTDYLDTFTERHAREQAAASDLLVREGLDPGKGSQVIDLLIKRGEISSANHPKTKTGREAADKATMEALDHPLAHAHRKVAELEKITGWLTKTAEMVQVTGRLHPQVSILGASATGRMSYSWPELQQFSAEARPIIVCDTGLTSVDWSQIEPVMMANCAQDWAFLDPFEAGADLYEPIRSAAGVERKVAKVLLLAAMYGQGRASMAKDLRMAEDHAQQLQLGMFSAMPTTKAFMDRLRTIGEQYGVVITADGRVLPIPKDPKSGKRLGYKAVNYFCQGSAYSVLAEALVRLEAAGLGDAIHLALHDEVVVDTAVAREVAEIMTVPPTWLLKWTGGRVPVFKVDATDMGRTWLYV